MNLILSFLTSGILLIMTVAFTIFIIVAPKFYAKRKYIFGFKEETKETNAKII